MTIKKENETSTPSTEGWVAQVNSFGLWVVGPELEDGTINVLGMGRTMEEAFEMAKKTQGRLDETE